MDLKCRKLGCVYNKDFACTAKGIEVTTSTNCKTYKADPEKKSEDIQDASKDMFEVAPDVHPFRHKKNVKIDCKAQCLFNENGKCVANGITVNDNKSNATCITVIEK